MLFVKGSKGPRSKATVELTVDTIFGGCGVVVHVWGRDENNNRTITHTFYTSDREFLEHLRDTASTALRQLDYEAEKLERSKQATLPPV